MFKFVEAVFASKHYLYNADTNTVYMDDNQMSYEEFDEEYFVIDIQDIDIEFIILSNTATQLEEQLIDLDRLLTIYYEASLLKLYNTQLKELKSIRESLANI